MNPILEQLIKRIILKGKYKRQGQAETYSNFKLASGFRELRIIIIRALKDMLLISAGIASAAFGLQGFLLPSGFIDGGATGVSLLISGLSGLPLYVWLLVVNIPFVFLGRIVVNRQFAIKTALAIAGLALCVAIISFPVLTHDKLLVSVFGGFFLGAGIGLSVRGGAVIDGTEVLALYLSRKFGTTIGDVIIVINAVIFSAAAYFLSIETALYSLITYLAASKTLDFVVEGIDEYTGVTIISAHSAAIRQMIIQEMGRGVTVYKGRQGYGKTGAQGEMDILYCVITRLELNKLNTEIQRIDSNAFVVMSTVKDTKGGMIKKRRLTH